jgi:hypothetical protein
MSAWLVRSVPCAAPARLRRASRFRAALSLPVAISLALPVAVPVVLSVGYVAAKRTMCCFCESKVDIAKITTQKLVNEAFPQWQRDHAANVAPAMDELFVYMDKHDDLDPWGVPFTLEWTPRGLVAVSRGADRVPGTADDIRSDE